MNHPVRCVLNQYKIYSVGTPFRCLFGFRTSSQQPQSGTHANAGAEVVAAGKVNEGVAPTGSKDDKGFSAGKDVVKVQKSCGA